jgi:hypothetical protein
MSMSCERRHAAVLVGILVIGAAAGPAAQQPPPAQRDAARELACGAQSPLLAPLSTMRIVGGPEVRKSVYATGEAVIINAGSAQGVRAGQEYFVRRVIADRFTQPLPNFFPVSVHTAGWVKIVEAEAGVAIATVTHACDGIVVGDFVEPFELPKVPTTTIGGEPDYSRPGHLILADERRQLGAPGVLMVLDRGTDHGLRPGQQLTIFRTTLKGAGPVFKVGTATAMVIRPETSLIRIDTATDSIYVGDLVAVHR